MSYTCAQINDFNNYAMIPESSNMILYVSSLHHFPSNKLKFIKLLIFKTYYI